jgi:polyhydroxybutyrate depolymerase
MRGPRHIRVATLAALALAALVAAWRGVHLLSFVWFAAPATGDRVSSIVVDGRTRTYIVHPPSRYDGLTPVPLVFVLHGALQTPESVERMSGMTTKADEAGFIAVYPHGTGRIARFPTWNAGACCGYAVTHGVDDVRFFRALLAQLSQDYRVDPRRVYATGISNGGMMSYRLACDMADKIAAIAPVEGAQDVECRPPERVSLIAFHGTADRFVPFRGGTSLFQLGPRRTDTPVDATLAFWARHDGCAPTPATEERTDLHIQTFTGCASTTGVELYAIKGGRHIWPGHPLSGNSVKATDLIWSFFASHPKE